MTLTTKNEWLIDQNGRTVLLRGLNLGGSSKVPTRPKGATHIKTDFRDHRDVSFVGRPFPLKEVDEHFRRIKHWGFNCLRFLITWEAIEHRGPKKYDKEYLDYIEELFKIAEKFKFYIFIDPHQDVWSRMTGGDGAPGWLFEKIGLDFTKFDESEAAFVMQYRYNPNNPKSYPPMYWDNNNVRFANASMWTLFFGGKDFAPSCKVGDINIQDYLQGHYIEAVKQIAHRVKDFSSIIGFDSLNEPKKGWIEDKIDGSGKEGFSEVLGHAFTPLDAMLTAAGYPRIIPYREIKFTSIKETRKDVLNKNRIPCWLEGAQDIWRREGIWDLDKNETPIILNNDHFTIFKGKKVDFYKDYLSPFILTFSQEIRTIIPHSIIFFEGPEVSMMMGKRTNFDLSRKEGPFVNAAHWYDVASVTTKKAWIRMSYDIMMDKLVFGKKKVQKMYDQQLAKIKKVSKYIAGGVPTLLGEFGLHFDLKKKKAYRTYAKKGQKAFKKNIEALNMYYNAMDINLLHGTQWNYTADNCNDWGDLWNLEDLSIFSRDQQVDPTDINSGGRAIKGFCRPHFLYCSGTPLKMEFNLKKGNFYFKFNGDTTIKMPTVIFIPKIQYPLGYEIQVSDGEVEEKKDEQLVYLNIKKDGVHTIEINRIS
ncbi:MAG: glycosyl hydrolase family 5 [Promethearchaeota archaeon]|nr:MAG: glycosyl hydrolase family 5 [Candidatus Lokiarchaeota archaeon]